MLTNIPAAQFTIYLQLKVLTVPFKSGIMGTLKKRKDIQMYRITVETAGKDHNVILGARYCLTRKTAIKIANLFLMYECYITVEKLIKCGGGVWYWSSAPESTKIIVNFVDNIAYEKRKSKN